jgi:hypothetical protein
MKRTNGSTGVTSNKSKGKVYKYTTEFRKQAIMSRISPKNLDVLLKYLGGLHDDLRRQMVLFKTRTVDEAYVQARHLDTDKKKRKPNGSKQIDQQGAPNMGKKKWKGKGKKIATTRHQ